jgi:hypothetical protein
MVPSCSYVLNSDVSPAIVFQRIGESNRSTWRKAVFLFLMLSTQNHKGVAIPLVDIEHGCS